MGCPIRKSSDQSSFAAPQGLSQRTTSFIASQRQGIHQMLLRHLIALMIDVRCERQPFGHPLTRPRSQKDQRQDPLGSHRCMLAEHIRPAALAHGPDAFPLHDVKHPRRGTRHPARNSISLAFGRPPLDATLVREWWSWTGSNRRPHACKARALPTELQPRSRAGRSARVLHLIWWAWDDSNVRPHPYQGCALTT